MLPLLHPWKQRTGWGGEARGTEEGLGVAPSANFWMALTFQPLPQSHLNDLETAIGHVGEQRASHVCLILLLECLKVSEGLIR